MLEYHLVETEVRSCPQWSTSWDTEPRHGPWPAAMASSRLMPEPSGAIMSKNRCSTTSSWCSSGPIVAKMSMDLRMSAGSRPTSSQCRASASSPPEFVNASGVAFHRGMPAAMRSVRRARAPERGGRPAGGWGLSWCPESVELPSNVPDFEYHSSFMSAIARFVPPPSRSGPAENTTVVSMPVARRGTTGAETHHEATV